MAGETDLFAPSFDPNDPASVAVWEAWKRRNLAMTRPLVEETRSPVSFNTGDPRGMVDPEALRVHAQGGPYDMNARRNSIAATIQAQQAAAQPLANQSQFEQAQWDAMNAAAMRQAMNPVQGFGGGSS